MVKRYFSNVIECETTKVQDILLEYLAILERAFEWHQ